MRSALSLMFTVVLFVLYSCNVAVKKGNGNIQSKEFDIDNYIQIELSGSPTLTYERKTDAKPYLRIEIDENLFPIISAEVASQKLTIKNKENIHATKYLIYTNSDSLYQAILSGDGHMILKGAIRSEHLTMSLKGSGSLLAENVECDKIDLSVSGSGSGEISGKATESNFKLNGSGKITAQEFTSLRSSNTLSGSGGIFLKTGGRADHVNLELKGSGRIVAENLDCSILGMIVHGAGQISANGKAAAAELNVHGSGRISAEELLLSKSKASVSGSGNVYINVSDSLNASINGSGNIIYSNSPHYIDTSVSGSGKVRKK